MPRKTRTLWLALLVTFLLVSSAGFALAAKGQEKQEKEKDEREKGKKDCRPNAYAQCDEDDDDRKGHGKHGKAEYAKEKGKWIVRNGDVSVWFHTSKHGEKAKPELRVFWTGTDGNKTGYSVKILRLFEIETDGTEYKGTYNTMKLSDSDDWNVDVQRNGNDLVLRMTHAEKQGIVTLVWYLNGTSKEIKFDLIVDNWQWGENAQNHRLVLDMLVKDRKVARKDNTSATLEGGYVSWVNTAKATYQNGSTRNLTVGHSLRGEGNDVHVLLAFNGPGGYKKLEYDPAFGVTTMSSDITGVRSVPVLATVGVLAAAGVAAAVIVLGRRDE
ncbi:MAG TPA: hypothetical protein VNZ52_04850 [Candidatus Thermoplasmatota archaeon]|nr:hypothetical protein [Candidatus Thermoplasmatota archaeon]